MTPSGSAGDLLREWRRRRRMSQLDLACDAAIAIRRLSHLESGHASPDKAELLHLSDRLAMPLRIRNTMLVAAGFEPAFRHLDLHAPAMLTARRHVDALLALHDPHPAVALDRHWVILAANKALSSLLAGAEPMLLRPPVNLLRLFLHPAGLAPRIVNLHAWRAHIISRLRRDIEASADPTLSDLLEEIRDYAAAGEPPQGAAGAMPLQLVTIDGTLTLSGATTRFDAPLDITLAEMTIEAFLPADASTAAILRQRAEGVPGPRI